MTDQVNEAVAWLLRDKRTKSVWVDENSHFDNERDAIQCAADMNNEIDGANFEAFPVYAHPSRGVVDDRSPSYDALLIIVQSVCGALDRAGIEECDDPGEAIDVMREKAERRLGEVEGLLREALRGWDDVIEDLELNGLHDDPHFNYRRQKEWIGAVEAKAGAALTKEPTK